MAEKSRDQKIGDSENHTANINTRNQMCGELIIKVFVLANMVLSQPFWNSVFVKDEKSLIAKISCKVLENSKIRVCVI